MNKFSPYYNHDEERVEMTIDEGGSWVHVTAFEEVQFNEASALVAMRRAEQEMVKWHQRSERLEQEKESVRSEVSLVRRQRDEWERKYAELHDRMVHAHQLDDERAARRMAFLRFFDHYRGTGTTTALAAAVEKSKGVLLVHDEQERRRMQEQLRVLPQQLLTVHDALTHNWAALERRPLMVDIPAVIRIMRETA